MILNLIKVIIKTTITTEIFIQNFASPYENPIKCLLAIHFLKQIQWKQQ
jgi:uncharacterized membrane protein